MTPSKQALVTQFMTTFNQTVRTSPCWLPPDELETRVNLIAEEFTELVEALESRNIYLIADGLADLLYVIYGTCASCGIDIDPIFAEVHSSNMSKLGGSINSWGKLVKPPNYSPPNIVDLIDLQCERE